MTEVTRILSQIEQGDPAAAELLLPVVYNQLRRLAQAKLAREKPGQTLQATALVHEAYVRLVSAAGQDEQRWNSRGHFFAAAAEAMRRILIESARRKLSKKHGGDLDRIELNADQLGSTDRSERLVALDEALTHLEQQDRQKAELVKLRFFAGLSGKEAAAALGISTTTADRDWAYARAWLQREMQTD
jgi:RNA polymerase sigma factor (TIGR02999 family)